MREKSGKRGKSNIKYELGGIREKSGKRDKSNYTLLDEREIS